MEFISTEDLYNLLISRTPSVMIKVLFNKLKENHIHITREQFSLLVILWQNDGCSQQFLADETYRDKPGITRLIDNLEKSKLVERKHDPYDKRSKLIYLTNKGILLEAKVTRQVKATVEDALEGIEIEKAKIFKEVLHKVYENLKGKI